MIEFVYVVTGIIRHFDGEITSSIVGVRKGEVDAKNLGSSWVIEKNKEIKFLGQHRQASYKLDLVEIR